MTDTLSPTELPASDEMRRTLAHTLCRISGHAYAEGVYYERADQIVAELREAGYVIARLSDREAWRLERREAIMAFLRAGHTMQEAGNRLGVSRQRISQVAKMLRKCP